MIAIDCDLRTAYGARVEPQGRTYATACNPMEVLGALNWKAGELVLFEVASPLDYTDGRTPGAKAIAYNKRKWTIWNIAMATMVYGEVGRDLRVAPSHAWTKGFALGARHIMANAKAKKKDLRECEAMLGMYRRTPSDWVTFPDFLAAL
jgi:hypothetical protein